jgi:D-glycero-alpha-D-manno-heptose-7-phosphate kinase
MIISRTPFRVSFAGGGTDLRAFYKKEPGAVTSTTIDKYMFITINKRFDSTIRASYSKTEIVNTAEEIKHPIVREALKSAGISNGIEITSIADVPFGTGLASSSSFTVGLLNALYAYLGKYKSAEELAQESCRIEIEILGEPIGKQDQYAAAYGGFLHIQFNPNEDVFVDPIICSKDVKDELNNKLMMFYTGLSRQSRDILKEQCQNTEEKFVFLKKMRDLSIQIEKVLIKEKNLDEIGEILHQAWIYKKKLVGTISNDIIDTYYEKARAAGALGGKILGAGGGGFLLFYCEKQNQSRVREALSDLKELPFRFEPQGSKIIYVG